MGLDNRYIISPKTTPTYDAIDAALGVGYAKYYGAIADGGEVVTVENTWDSNGSSFATVAAMPATNSGLVIEKNFDINFKTPQSVEGTFFANLTYELHCSSSSSQGEGYVIVKVYHVTSGGTETELATETLDTINAAGAGDFQSKRAMADMAIARTHFAIGEKLRFCVLCYGHYDVAGADFILYHDPTSRFDTGEGIVNAITGDTAAHKTDIVFTVPYRIDL